MNEIDRLRLTHRLSNHAQAVRDLELLRKHDKAAAEKFGWNPLLHADDILFTLTLFASEEEIVSNRKAPAEEASEKKAPSKKAPAEEAPAEDAPAEEAPAEEAPTEEAPVEEAPAEEAPAEEEPSKKAPSKKEAKKK